MSSTFLICGNDPDLLGTRSLILRHAGFAAIEVKRSPALDLSHLHSPVAGAIFCHTLTRQQKTSYTSSLHERWPGLPLLQLLPISVAGPPPTPDVTPISASPAALVAACKRVALGRSPTRLPTQP